MMRGMGDLWDRALTIVGGLVLLVVGVGVLAVADGATQGLVIGWVLFLAGVVLTLVAIIAAGVAWGMRGRR